MGRVSAIVLLVVGCGPDPEQAIRPMSADGDGGSAPATGGASATTTSDSDAMSMTGGAVGSSGAVGSTGAPVGSTGASFGSTGGPDPTAGTGMPDDTTGGPPPPMLDPDGPYGDCSPSCVGDSQCMMIDGRPGQVCAPYCFNAVDCVPPLPGLSLECLAGYNRCMIQCTPGCPAGMICNVAGHCVWP